ncbi:LytTr DNA-binding domain-containing protein [Arcicella aurantiaca]|uniref:LytTr DNA-binding domain-containing protein n=1 Tax=Arcicella aurantiaca TaxID=591202 RepID=A0A316EBR6_9BACT|nr:LytTr DNA-binding domain-containing protein [Arcicella aurantiaca]
MENKLSPIKFLTVNYRKKIRIPMENIIMLEASGNYTIFHIRNQKKHLYAKCINTFEEPLRSEGFLRVHRGYIINPDYMVDYDEGSSLISMKYDLKVVVSRRKKVNLRTEVF